jgi:hypothetical protein
MEVVLGMMAAPKEIPIRDCYVSKPFFMVISVPVCTFWDAVRTAPYLATLVSSGVTH